MILGYPYFYQLSGNTGEYDLILLGADSVVWGDDKNADISVKGEASQVATWFEYTPTSVMDIGITMNAPNSIPIAIKSDLAYIELYDYDNRPD